MRALGVYRQRREETQTQAPQSNEAALSAAPCTMIYKDENVEATVNAVIADSTEFWWNKPDQRTLWDSKIELG